MVCSTLAEVRTKIDCIDNEIVQLLAQRGQYVAQAAAFKTSENSVKAPDRVEAVLAGVRQKARKYGADPVLTEKLYRDMIAHFTHTELSLFAARS